MEFEFEEIQLYEFELCWDSEFLETSESWEIENPKDEFPSFDISWNDTDTSSLATWEFQWDIENSDLSNKT